MEAYAIRMRLCGNKNTVQIELCFLFAGPSDEIRTHGLLLPKQARYQLRYTRIS